MPQRRHQPIGGRPARARRLVQAEHPEHLLRHSGVAGAAAAPAPPGVRRPAAPVRRRPPRRSRVLPTPPGPTRVSSRAGRDQGAQLGQGLGPADQLVQLGGQAVADDRGLGRGAQARVLVEDLPVQGGQFGTRVEAQFVGEPLAQPGVALQGLGLPPRGVQGADVQGAQALPQRMALDQLGQLRGDQVVLAAGQPGLASRSCTRRRCSVSRVASARANSWSATSAYAWPRHSASAAPSRSTSVAVDERGEPVGVHVVGPQPVARRPRLDQVTGSRFGVVERLAQLRHAHLQRGGRVRGCVVAPQVLDEPVRGDHLVAVRQQVGEQHPDLGAGHHHRLAVVGGDGERTEDSEAHSGHPNAAEAT